MNCAVIEHDMNASQLYDANSRYDTIHINLRESYNTGIARDSETLGAVTVDCLRTTNIRLLSFLGI